MMVIMISTMLRFSGLVIRFHQVIAMDLPLSHDDHAPTKAGVARGLLGALYGFTCERC